MRLLNPDPGEVADRMTILTLKIKYGTAKGKDVTAFQAEYKELDRYIDSNFAMYGTDAIPHEELVGKLLWVNSDLWKLEDEIREFMKEVQLSSRDRVLEIAFAIPRANDERMELVKQINALFNITRQEKLY